MTYLSPRHGCAEFRRSQRFTRRALLQAGMLGTTGLSLADVLRSDAAAAATGRSRSTKSVILLWMQGGPSHIDMWDPKPEAPVEIRGAFDSISTAVPGIQLSEYLPLSAKIMDKWSLVRSLHYRKEDGFIGHFLGDQVCFTGYRSGRDPMVNSMPSCGSILTRQQRHLNPKLPAYVMIPKMLPGTGSAWLGSGHDPFETQTDPAASGPFALRNFTPAEGVSLDRLRQRKELLRSLDRATRSESAAAVDAFQQQAVEIVAGGLAHQAFDLEQEPQSLRERYGLQPVYDTGNGDEGIAKNWAQRMLLARRLVEAGVRLVTVDLAWWDFHKDGFNSQRRGFLPRFDQAYSALIEDLEQRGLLDSTLVVAWGEMGRAPRVNESGGRDHWPQVFSAAIAGGGVRGGRVVGSSDRIGAEPIDSPKHPQDVLATIYQHLGVDTTAQYIDSAGRPHPVLPHGNPLHELLT